MLPFKLIKSWPEMLKEARREIAREKANAERERQKTGRGGR